MVVALTRARQAAKYFPGVYWKWFSHSWATIHGALGLEVDGDHLWSLLYDTQNKIAHIIICLICVLGGCQPRLNNVPFFSWLLWASTQQLWEQLPSVPVWLRLNHFLSFWRYHLQERIGCPSCFSLVQHLIFTWRVCWRYNNVAGPESAVRDEWMNIADVTTPLTEFSTQKGGQVKWDAALDGGDGRACSWGVKYV